MPVCESGGNSCPRLSTRHAVSPAGPRRPTHSQKSGKVTWRRCLRQLSRGGILRCHRFLREIVAALAAGRSDLASATAEAQSAKAELASLDKTMALRKARIEEAVAGARARCEKARIKLETAQDRLTQAMTARAAQAGRLTELRRLRDAEDYVAAETRLREATERYAALPVPERNVTKDNVECC